MRSAQSTPKTRLPAIATILFLLSILTSAYAGGSLTHIPMQEKGGATFYVEGYLDGLGDLEMMVDTGSGYLTINQEALRRLRDRSDVHYVKDLRGTLANGQELIVPVYTIGDLRIGASCWLHDVEAAVFPGRTRFILGLSVLAKTAPFMFQVEPPQLSLSNCGSNPVMGQSLAQNRP